MGGILNDVEDFDGFLDLPNDFPDDILLDDLESLDFINDLDGNLIYECDVNPHNQQIPVSNCAATGDVSHYSKVAVSNNSENYYRNCVSNVMPLVFNKGTPVKESGVSGHTMIRELLSSDTAVKPNLSQGSYVTIDRYNDGGRQHVSNGNHNIRTHENRNIIPRHPIILPATSGSNGHLLRTPTLAATLIGMQSSPNDNLDDDSPSYSGGKVVRRNSHNAIEKRYRLSINDRIDELRHMLSLGDNSKMNKSAVLRKAVERIRSLEQENNSLKCDNYNLRKSLANNSSNESLNRTGSSPLSNQSDSGHSITNSPSSSSMHSTSVSSSFLFCKNGDNQPSWTNNVSKGIKRPLIYDNNTTSVKTEKLARLLLSSSDSYEDKYSGQSKDEINDRSQTKRLHASNMPSFLLCTMALFIVAFQPLDIVFNNFRTKVVTVTGGRKILQVDPLTDGLGVTVLLALSHWLLAFLLIWSSTTNRYLLTKLTSFLLSKARSMTFITFHYNTPLNGDTVESVQAKVNSWRKDPSTVDMKLKDQLRLYHCACPCSVLMFVVQLGAVVGSIMLSFVQVNIARSRINKEAHKIAMRLVTRALEQSVMGSKFTGIEALWYRTVLMLIIRYGEDDQEMALSKLVLAQSISPEWIRKYFVKSILATMVDQTDSVNDKYRSLIGSTEMGKILMKNSLRRVKEKLEDNYLMMTNTCDMIHSYYIVYVQESLALIIKKIMAKEVDLLSDVVLKDIVQTCSVVLSEEEANYIGSLCEFVASKSHNEGHHLIGLAHNLLHYYNGATLNNSSDDARQIILSLKLLLSTTKLTTGKDNGVHITNLDLIGSITARPINNIVARLVFDAALSVVIRSLNNGQINSLPANTFDIYYADQYATQLRNYSDKHTAGFETMVNNFDVLFQSLCQLNPIKSGFSNIGDCKDKRKFDGHSYRVTEFLSLDGVGQRECNNSKMRSH